MHQIFILFLFTLIACNSGGGGSSSGGIPIPTETYVVTGTLTYDYVPVTTELNFAGKSQLPMRNVYVEAVRVADGRTLASGSTNDSGTFTLNVPRNQTVRFEISAKMVSPSVTIEDNTDDNAVYVAYTNNYTISGNTNLTFNASCGWTGTNDGGSYTGTRVAAPFAILDSIYSAVLKVKADRPSITFPALKVNWSVKNIGTSGDITLGQIGTSHYDGTELYILGKSGVDSDEFDRHVIVHEWGHYFEGKLSRSDSLGGQHGSGDIMDRSVAFGEGWGNALSAMVFDPSYTYLDSMWIAGNNTIGVSMNMENGSDVNPGWYSEASVQQILFDVFDSHADANDSVALGIGPIIDILMTTQKTTNAMTSIHSFITGLKSANASSAAAIDTITTNKSVVVNDIYGTGETNDNGIAALLPLYTSLTVGGASATLELAGNPYRYNEAPNNKYFRFTATSTTTRINWNVTDLHYIYVMRRGSVVFQRADYADAGNATFSTTVGQEYIIQVLTDPDNMTDASQSMDVQISVQ